MDEIRALFLSVGHELVSIVIAAVGAWVSSKIHSRVKKLMQDLNAFFNGLRDLSARVEKLEKATFEEEE